MDNTNQNSAASVVSGITSFLSGANQPTIKHRIDPESLFLAGGIALVVIVIAIALKKMTK